MLFQTLCRRSLPAMFALIGCFTAFGNAAGEVRTWSTADGKYQTMAEFLKLEDQKVYLRRSDGKEIAVPLRVFSTTDKEYVRREVLRRRNEEAPAAANDTSAAPSSVGDWPRWRGPNNDGISQEKGLLDQWPADGPPLVWQVEGLGTGYGSVSVADGKIFVMGRIDGMEYLMALDVNDGSQIWATPVGRGSRERGPNCSPTVDGNRVYGLSFEGDLICVEAATGKELWKKSFPRDFGGRMMSGWGYSESPLIDGDRLICTPGGQQAMMAALDKETGRTIWQTAMPDGGQAGRDGAGYSSAVVSHAGGVKQYVQLVGRGVIGVDAASGRLLWRYDRVANGTANVPTPIVKDDYVFCSTGYNDGGTALLQIIGGRGGMNVREVYYKSSREMQNHHGGMILLGDHIYMGNKHNQGFPLCINMKTGQIAWEPGRGPGNGSAAIVYADGDLYFRYESGVMALIEATPQRYNLKSQFQIASRRAQSWPHPVIASGKLYLRDQEVLLCYDIRQ